MSTAPGLATTRDAAARALPSVDAVLREPGSTEAIERFGRAAMTDAVRTALAEARQAVRADATAPSSAAIAVTATARLAEADLSSLRPVFNLTGTVLHTNLGRALLAEAAITAAVDAMRDPAAVEFDLDTGARGERDDHLRTHLCALTGAEDATFVNNNAAAVLIVLNTLGAGRDAIVSRGELIEIGGAFRMPDIMSRAGVNLVEVGTTNRTHDADYRRAIGAQTGLILKVHTSNYRIAGFTAEVEARALAGIARDVGVPLVNDLGSGTLIDLTRYGLAKEPTVREAVEEGADLVTFSGDKLLGGPQAGFIVGRADLIAAVNRNPMKRALRLDKIRIAALAATLQLYRDPDRLAARLPTLRLLARTEADILAQAQRLLPQVMSLLTTRLGATAIVEVRACKSQIGSGALPLDTLPSAGLRIAVASGSALERLGAALRRLPRPVIGRIRDGALVLDLRCLEDDAGFLQTLAAIPADALA